MERTTPVMTERLRLALRAAHVPQREAADILGISQPALADKLAGRRPMRPREAMVVAQLANIDCTHVADTVREMEHIEAHLAALQERAEEQLRDVICALETPEPVSA